MTRFARVLVVRLAWVLGAVLIATVILTATFAQWRDTGYGNTDQFLDQSDSALWATALGVAVETAGISGLLHVMVNIAVTRQYPLGRWVYWLTFLPVVAWALYIARSSSAPISDAGVLYILLPLAWALSIVCLVVGLVERLARMDTTTSSRTPQ